MMIDISRAPGIHTFQEKWRYIRENVTSDIVFKLGFRSCFTAVETTRRRSFSLSFLRRPELGLDCPFQRIRGKMVKRGAEYI